MSISFLREVVIIIVGKFAEPIADLLMSKKHVNEFLLAKKLDITINQTRNILYKLADYGVVSSIRKKDKKKGWYTYFWKFETIKALEFLRSIYEKRAEKIKVQISNREKDIFYICQRCNIEMNESNALLCDFTCNECGDIFAVKDNTELLKQLKKNFKRLDLEIETIDSEIKKESDKIEKQREKELAKAKKEAKKKLAKKKGKKKVAKKKVVKKKIVNKKATRKKVTRKKVAKKKVAKKKVAKKKVAKKKTAKKATKKKTTKKKVTKKSFKKKSVKKKSSKRK